jgi:4'-phosphopantetheinyl transferase EntD
MRGRSWEHDAATDAKLYPSENIVIAGTSPQRRAAFRNGRACSRAALAKINVASVPIPVGAGGAPIWPKGIVGSISHTDSIAVAVVASTPPVLGLGIDIEDDDPLETDDLVATICRPDERLPGCDLEYLANRRHGKLLFSIKEAVYKIYWPLSNTHLDFHDLRITLDHYAGTFWADLVQSHLPSISEGRSISDRFHHQDGLRAQKRRARSPDRFRWRWICGHGRERRVEKRRSAGAGARCSLAVQCPRHQKSAFGRIHFHSHWCNGLLQNGLVVQQIEGFIRTFDTEIAPEAGRSGVLADERCGTREVAEEK